VLRKNSPGYQDSWTEEEVRAGLRHFYELHRRYPTAHEIDDFEYLPSSRSIQRSFGGLVALRGKLMPGEVSNFTSGEYRRSKAREADLRARGYEEEFYKFLTANFFEIAIHEHRIIRPGGIASDFFVYLTELSGIVIDLFYAQDIRSLANIVNIKLKRYEALPYPTYFVLVGNPTIGDDLIKRKMANRTLALPAHIKVTTEGEFKRSIVEELRRQSKYCRIA
jgi:hypothetical protein